MRGSWSSIRARRVVEMMKRFLPCLLIAALATPSIALAKPNDAVHVFTGVASGTFASRNWQTVPGTKGSFVTPGKYGDVELAWTFRLAGACEGLGHCETAVMLDGEPAAIVEDALDGDGLSSTEPGHHTVQLAVRCDPGVTVHVDGPWRIDLEQVRS
jgi:hypothetical protein